MSENTRQLNWIIAVITNLRGLFADNPKVFVAGNQFWYPVEGDPDIRVAPDVYVVFGRPKGDRASYKLWEEGNVPMTVVFEVLSPSNTALEMADKLAFYDDYGVQEYYVYDPDTNSLHGFIRHGQSLVRIRRIKGHISPQLGIRFDLTGSELVVRYPDGRPFLTFEELEAERLREQQRADNAEQRAARMAELATKALRQEATPEEMLELQRLLQTALPASPPPSEVKE
jgi:Uma2 family endonuclease